MDRTDRQPSACPAEEDLLVYVGGLPDGTNGLTAVATHVQQCDGCVAEMARIQQRLAIADSIAMPVPSEVAARALAAFGGRRVRQPSWWSTTLESLREAMTDWRSAILVPVGVAAAALLMVELRSPQPGVPPQTELTRDVSLRQAARVTSASAALRPQPDAQSQALRTLARGDSVVLFERQQDWYQVALPDGTQGWIEVAAFE